MSTFASCGCGCTYTRAAWAALPFVGVLDDVDDDGSIAEMRNCGCGSTIAAIVERGSFAVAVGRALKARGAALDILAHAVRVRARAAVVQLASLVGLVLLVAACSSSGSTSPALTRADAGREILRALCAHLDVCYPSDFAAAYPAGVDACVESAGSKLTDPGGASKCSQAEIDQCVVDTNASTCAATPGATSLPDSCGGC